MDKVSGVRGGDTRGLAICPAPPLLELGIAVRASAAVDAARIIARVLVEGDFEAAVVVAEDVAAFAAMVTTRKVAEVPLAGRVVAYCRFLVGLQHAGDRGQRLRTGNAHAPLAATDIPSSAFALASLWA